jgi:hypothetical protein
MAIIKRQINQDNDVNKLELQYIAGGNIKWCSFFGKQFENSSKFKHRPVPVADSCNPNYLGG